MAHYEPSHQDLRCLQIQLCIISGYNAVPKVIMLTNNIEENDTSGKAHLGGSHHSDFVMKHF